MQRCKNCSHPNPDDALICERCGLAMYGAIASVAKSSPDEPTKKKLIQRLVSFLSKGKTEQLVVDDHPTQRIVVPKHLVSKAAERPDDVSIFPAGSSLLFHITGNELVINAPTHDIWVGRFGGKVPPPRDVHIVNLGEYDGYRMGISRLHATIRPNGQERLEIFDLASSNGTRLNGQKLAPYEIYHLYDGDEIQFGQLRVQVYFLYP